MARKRPRIYPRTTSKGEQRYDVSLDFYDEGTGKRKQKMFTFKTEKEARQALAAHEARGGKVDVRSVSKDTLAELAARWLAAHAAAIKPGTLDTYHRCVREHILPGLGQVPVQRLTLTRLDEHYAALRGAGVGAGVLRNVHHRLIQMLRWGALHGLPVDASALQARCPQYSPHEMTCWSDEEMGRFLVAADGTKLALFWRVAVMTGMRRGELMGLKWQHIDWDHATLRVCESRTRVNGHIVVGTTKNNTSRAVSVPANLMAALKEHRVIQLRQRVKAGAAWQDADLVFTNEVGQTLQPDRLRRSLNSVVARAGLAPVRIHDLRHTHASFLFRHGKSAVEVSKRLGHKNVAQTLNVYAHCLPDQHRETADLLGRIFA